MNEIQKECQEEKPLFVKLFHAAGCVEERMEDELANIGLSLSKFAVLHQLTKAGKPLPLTALAEKCACVKSNVTQLVDALEDEGLVERVDDPEDRRSKLAVMKEEGRRRYKMASQTVTETEKEFFDSLKMDERQQLGKFLERLCTD